LGATLDRAGTNFSLFAKSSRAAQLLLFDSARAPAPSRVIDLDPRANRTYHYWHTFVPGVAAGQVYAYRISGPFDPERGLRFDPSKVLLDPYGKCIARPAARTGDAARRPGDNIATALRSVVVDPSGYDWEGDAPIRRPFAKTVLYEMHVGGFTRHPSSGVAPGKRGTFAGLIEKVPYLRDLGVSAVELLPVFAFDQDDGPPGLGNYWGYHPLSFFAPHDGYSSRRDPLGALDEFRDMVKALHRAGIEVILDVVYNHTAEGNHLGPTLSFRGIDNSSYYWLQSDQPRYYDDFTGCGNALNLSHPRVLQMVMDSLRFWVEICHVDGFRFDLASTLGRGRNGFDRGAAFFAAIRQDPVLAAVKLIAEPWDIGPGGYQVGKFPPGWSEWNDHFRRTLRRYWAGEGNIVGELGRRMTGSADLFDHDRRSPRASVNHVTVHDGFTLADLVSYHRKHNLANGEHNRDGSDDNQSTNCGVEGATDKPDILRLRRQLRRNLLASLMLAQGVPLLLAGDEVGNGQRGNNNAYCQDNAVGWVDWSALGHDDEDMTSFVTQLAELRRRFPQLRARRWVQGRLADGSFDVLWLTPRATEMAEQDWHFPEGRFLSYVLGPLKQGAPPLYLVFNAAMETIEFTLPVLPEYTRWTILLETVPAFRADGEFRSGSKLEAPPRSILAFSGAT